MKLVLKNSAGDSVALQINPGETFIDLRDRVETEVGVNLDLNVLAVRGRKIDETQKVVDYFVGGGNMTTGGPLPAQNYHCSVPGCSNTKQTTPDRCFFKFPEEEVRCHQWVLYCQRLNTMSGKPRLNLTSDSAVCSDHFRSDQFVKNTTTLLKRTAVPSINPELPFNDSSIKRPSLPSSKPQAPPTTPPPTGPTEIKLDPSLLVTYAPNDPSLITLVPTELDLDSQITFADDNRDPLCFNDEEFLKFKTGNELTCRLCAEKTNSYLYIYDRDGESLGLAKKINDCLPFEIKPTDHLPKQICKDCYIKLMEVYELAEMSLESENRFQMQTDCIKAEQLYSFPANFLNDLNTDETCKQHSNEKLCCPLCKEGKLSTEDSSLPASDIASVMETVEPSPETEMPEDENSNGIENDTSSCGSFLNTEFTNPNLSYAFVQNEVTAKDIDEILNKPLNVDLPFALDNCSQMFDGSETISLDDYKQSMEFEKNLSQNMDVVPIKHTAEDSKLDLSLTSIKEEEPSEQSEEEKSSDPPITKRSKFPYHCETCGLLFRKPSSLVNHECIELANPNNKCTICSKTFRSDARLLFHMKFHEGAKPGYCEVCQKTFPDETKLYKHTIYLHGGEKSHCCEECGKVFRSSSSLRYHQRSHLGTTLVKPFSCDKCGKGFIRKTMLKNHITSIHNAACREECSFTCKICFEAFPATDLAVAHMERRHVEECNRETYSFDMHTVNRLYMCEYCDKCFAEGTSLNKHRDEHSTKTPYQCKTCDFVFGSFSDRSDHILQFHLNSPPILEYSVNFKVPNSYLCEFCDRCFTDYVKFTEHLTIHFGNEPYSCRYCSIRMASLKDAIEHRSSHPEAEEPTEEFNVFRPHECHYCDKSFAIEDALIKHIRMHTGEKPFICDQCGKGFSQSSGLYTHQKVHSNVRPYMCDMCPRTFKIKGDRDVHVRKHTGDRPYKCEFCGKAFMTQHVYSQHRKIHTGERPYKCDVCGIAFRRSHVLTVHKRIHTGEKPNICDVCGKRYRQKGDMLKHRRIQHGVLKVQLQGMLNNSTTTAGLAV